MAINQTFLGQKQSEKQNAKFNERPCESWANEQRMEWQTYVKKKTKKKTNEQTNRRTIPLFNQTTSRPEYKGI